MSKEAFEELRYMAAIYRKRGLASLAARMYEQLIRIGERAHEVDSAELALAYYHLGDLYFQFGKQSQSMDLFRKAVAAWERSTASPTPGVLWYLEALKRLKEADQDVTGTKNQSVEQTLEHLPD